MQLKNMETWWNYFDLKYDPFSTSPLSRESQRILLYKTKDISEKIDTEIFGLRDSLPFIRLLIGSRGIGKTTVLHYIQQETSEISNIMPIYIDITFDEDDKSTDPSILIASNILNRFIEEILIQLRSNKKNIWKNNLDIFQKIIYEGGFITIDPNVQCDPFKKIHFVELKRISQWILKILESDGVKPLLLIDNIDKNIEPAKKFMTEPTSQSIFEMIGRSNGMIFISCKNNLIEDLKNEKKEDEISYLLDNVFLNSLKPIEAYNLVQHRLISASNANVINIIDFETIQEIALKKNGITRSILSEVKNVLQKAHAKGIKSITKSMVASRDFVRKDNNLVYKKIIDEDPAAKKGSEHIAKIFDYVKNRPVQFKNAIRYLIKIKQEKRPFIKESKFQDEFQLNGIIYYDVTNKKLRIHPSIDVLFTNLEENGLELNDFFDWFIDSKIDEIDLTPRPDIFENEIESVIDRIKLIQMSVITKSYHNNHIEIKNTRNDTVELLQKSISLYENIGKEDWDEIEQKNILFRINESFFYFCKAYAYYLASYYNEDFCYDGICDRKSDWDNIYYFVITKSASDFGYLNKWNLITTIRNTSAKVYKNYMECPSKEELQILYEEMHEPVKELCEYWKKSIRGNPIDFSSSETQKYKYDVFISHASEDKETFVRPLAQLLKNENVNVWYDEFTLKLGDSLRCSIDKGISESRYGVVVLSKAFFNKKWAQLELSAFVSQIDKEKNILPIWYNVGKKEVEKFSPILADKVAVSSENGLSFVVKKILEAINE